MNRREKAVNAVKGLGAWYLEEYWADDDWQETMAYILRALEEKKECEER